MIRIKTLLLALLGATALASHGAPPAYPAGPVRLVVPFSAGGPVDAFSRVIAEPLGKALGQPVIIDNKPGAGTKIAIEHVAAAPADGLTLLMSGATFSMLRHLTKLKIDADRDLVPVAQVAVLPQVLVVRNDLPVKDVRELVAYAKAHPDKLNYALPGGNGTSLHLQAELFQRLTQTRMLSVPYKGSPPALMDLVAGRIDLMFDIYGSSAPFIREGKVRLLGISPGQRSTLMPDVPTIAEAGVPGFDVTAWAGILAPAATPPAVLDVLWKALAAVLQRPDVQDKLRAMGVDPVFAGPQETAARMASDSVRWEKLIDSLGLKHQF